MTGFGLRIGRLQHGVIVYQFDWTVRLRLLETGVPTGALDVNPAKPRSVQWLPLRRDGVDPLRDIREQVLAMEAGNTSRRTVVKATGLDMEEIERENAADAALATGLGLRYRTEPGDKNSARKRPKTRALRMEAKTIGQMASCAATHQSRHIDLRALMCCSYMFR